jgi:hypothetical protein
MFGQNERRGTSLMPYRRRHQGLTANDRREEDRLWQELISFILLIGGLLGNLPLMGAALNLANELLMRVLAMRAVVWHPHPRIDKVSL